VCDAAAWSCPDGFSKCYGSTQCVLDYFFDDGENDCNFGTDELQEYLGTVIGYAVTLLKPRKS